MISKYPHPASANLKSVTKSCHLNLWFSKNSLQTSMWYTINYKQGDDDLMTMSKKEKIQNLRQQLIKTHIKPWAFLQLQWSSCNGRLQLELQPATLPWCFDQRWKKGGLWLALGGHCWLGMSSLMLVLRTVELSVQHPFSSRWHSQRKNVTAFWIGHLLLLSYLWTATVASPFLHTFSTSGSCQSWSLSSSASLCNLPHL